MMNHNKYKKQFFNPPETGLKWAQKDSVQKAPVWCSVDLRDGNQALVVPMDLETKLLFFELLVKIGFKEIEVGFPAASETEYEFLRALIERDLVPKDVTLQVLTQAREHIIRRTFEALEGCSNAIVHVYNSTSLAQREQVFKKSREEIKQIAVEGAQLLKQLTEEAGQKYRFEYSPESFTGTEPEYALEVCNAVLDVWQPTADRKAIINLPSTVQLSMPHVYANQIEYLSDNLKYRDNVVLSLHPHNDRGTGVADAEMGLLAGADRIEGTIFGNGERTGNVDVVTLALNMYSQGVDPQLHFDNMLEIVDKYEEYTGMDVNPRTPYGGALVFAAFSGSHQDAIAKGMAYRAGHDDIKWTVPYIPIDPTDIGRSYDADVIRINSQSGTTSDSGFRRRCARASATWSSPNPTTPTRNSRRSRSSTCSSTGTRTSTVRSASRRFISVRETASLLTLRRSTTDSPQRSWRTETVVWTLYPRRSRSITTSTMCLKCTRSMRWSSLHPHARSLTSGSVRRTASCTGARALTSISSAHPSTRF